MQAEEAVKSVCVVGAGLGGSMMTLYLARRGYRVTVFERRRDPRLEEISTTSMNLGLSRRGIESLRRAGLAEQALQLVIPMSGRVIHDLQGRLIHQPYGNGGTEVINAIRRGDINALLIRAAAALPQVTFAFQTRVLALDPKGPSLDVRDEAGGEERRETFDFVVGADGLFSPVRQSMHRGERAEYAQEFLDWGWKELTVPPGPGGTSRMEREAFHLWPRGGSLLFAHPNKDGSFTCSLVLPFQGPRSFATLTQPGAVSELFSSMFPDLLPLIPDLEEQFARRPIINLVTTRTSPWHYEDKVVLLGDAAHAVVPFYAQGMNAAFEDCAVLDDCLGRRPEDRRAAFAEYQAIRKPNTDALAEMSKQNFLELRDSVRSPWPRARKTLDLFLHRLLGEAWMPLHARVTHTCVPYARAVEMTRRQTRILVSVGVAAAMALLWLVISSISG
jgi:kynurenine 3-monooxygenase